jgi:AraC family transcriptional regulator of adaptative response / DNA-3-methyladenine glycosylase II
MLAYLRLRAIPGVESVDETHYRRTVAIGEHQGFIGVSLAASGTALEVELSPGLAPVIGAVIVRVKNLFDLGATPDAVAEVLSQDPMLAGVVRRLPGLRVPGAFDGFELAVRAVLGQQVSVRGATTLAGRWAARMCSVAADEIAALGVVGARARCLVALAHAAAERRIVLGLAADVEEQIERLTALPGIGPWTAQYIAMRALRWPDAFPAEDLMVLRAAGLGKKELRARAEAWRPWRAYATHYLWQSLGVVT